MKLAFLGSGNVGATLADHLQRLGHEVTLAARDPQSDSIQKALAHNPQLQVMGLSDAVAQADVVFLTTPFQANQAVLEQVAPQLAGKVLVDCTNPVGAGLVHGLNSVQAGSEYVQSLVPSARVVKAFSIYGYENFAYGALNDLSHQPVMMLCGEDAQAKSVVAQLSTAMGWEPLDVGGLAQAVHLEHMTLLWVRMVRMGQSPNHSAHLLWSAVRY